MNVMPFPELQPPPQPQLREFNALDRCLIAIAGGDAEELAKCSLRDVGNFKACAWLLIGVGVWQWTLYTLVGHMMFALPGEFKIAIVCGAGVLAAIVMLVDSYVVVRSSWSMQGLAELKKGGLAIPGTLLGRFKGGLFLLVRIFLASVMATLMAIFLSMVMFEKDLAADREKEFHAANALLLRGITERVDGVIRRKTVALDELRSRVAKTIDEEAQYRHTSVDPAISDPTLAVAMDDLKRLSKEKGDAEAALADAQTFASNELSGFKGAPGNTGIPGRGKARAAAEERVANAKSRLDRIAQELTAAQTKLGELRDHLAGSVATTKEAAERRLGEAGSARAELSRGVSEAEAELQRLIGTRESTIQTALLSDPAYVARQDGFIARLNALYRISEAPHVKFVVILLELAMLGIDIAAVLAKVFTFIPSGYSTRIAKDDYLRAAGDALGIIEETEIRQMQSQARLQRMREPPPLPPAEPGSTANETATAEPVSESEGEPAALADNDEVVKRAEPPRRKRGRPKGSYKVQLQPLDAGAASRQGPEVNPGEDQPDEKDEGEDDIQNAHPHGLGV